MENISSEDSCPSCHAPVSAALNFCPQCGAKLKEPPVLSKVEGPLSTSVRRQTFIYLISFFLAPFGLGYAFKYLKQSNPKARRVGVIVIILTILAIALMVWATNIFTNWEYQSINTL